jgi:hypothetical protein
MARYFLLYEAPRRWITLTWQDFEQGRRRPARNPLGLHATHFNAITNARRGTADIPSQLSITGAGEKITEPTC